MKKNIFSWMTIVLMAFVVCAGFSACGDDDDNEGGGNASIFIGTWRKYSSDPNTGEPSSELGHVIWVFNTDGTMYEHDIDDDLNIIEGSTETFKYKAENNHLYTDKLKKDGYRNEWKDEGTYVISGNTMDIFKDDGKGKHRKRYLKIK